MNAERPLCPVCEKGRLSTATYADEFEHRGETIHIEGLESYICERCGAEPMFEDQIRRNDRRVIDARRRADGLLTGEQIRTLRKQLGLTQQQASQVFGGGANAFSKYERGDVIQSAAMDKLLRLVDFQPTLLELLRVLAGAERPDNFDVAYHTTGKISLNDDDYRSRQVRGPVVEAGSEDWTTKESA